MTIHGEEIKAKDISILSKIGALVFVVGMYISAVVVMKRLPTANETAGVMQVGIFMMLVFAPVDVSMIVKNIKGV